MDRSTKIRINGELRGTPRVRVIGRDGEMLGVMTLAAALRLALKEGLDLVEVNPEADPPVCKILDFGKYRPADEGTPRAVVREPSAAEAPEPEPLVWTPFECDGRRFEYLAGPTRGRMRPPGWPAYEASTSAPHVMVYVRNPGDETGAAIVFPEGTVITVEHAIETARRFWSTLTR